MHTCIHATSLLITTCWLRCCLLSLSRSYAFFCSPALLFLLQVMDYVTGTEGRKILVHCHAGLGRTGLAIACYFLYTGQYGGRRAVEAVRRDRPGALQTRQQEMFVVIFEQYLAHLRSVCLGGGGCGQVQSGSRWWVWRQLWSIWRGYENGALCDHQ